MSASIQAMLWHLEDDLWTAVLGYEVGAAIGTDSTVETSKLLERIRQLAGATARVRRTYNDRHGL